VHGYHRMLSAKFPYAVYYDVVQDQIRVRAVLDCRRNPKWELGSLSTLDRCATEASDRLKIVSAANSAAHAELTSVGLSVT